VIRIITFRFRLESILRSYTPKILFHLLLLYFHYGTFVLGYPSHSPKFILQHQNNKEQKFFPTFKEIKPHQFTNLTIMLKKIGIGFGVIFLAIIAFFGYGILFPVSPPTTTNFSAQGIDITVNYSQPSKKGRLIFGDEASGALQPHGTYWRLGANAATEITFSKDINFAGQAVAAGTYRMYAVPGASSFEITLNSELGVFLGVQEPDYTKDVVKVNVPVSSAPSELELFTISFEESGSEILMNIAWDTTLVAVPISVN
jgi:hypothetical protein